MHAMKKSASKNHCENRCQNARFLSKESEEPSSLKILMEGDNPSAVKALDVIKRRLYENFARAGVYDTEDLIGETLLRLCELHQGNDCLEKEVIEKTAQEVHRRFLREKIVGAEVQLEFLDLAVPAPEFEIQEDSPTLLVTLLNLAVESLPENDQEIVRLHIVNKVSFEELAGLSALSTNGVKVRHYRAIDKLRLTFLREFLSRYRHAA